MSERQYQINPLVQESMIHNGRILSNFQSITAPLFGVTAGVLGLESYTGFLLYFVLSIIATVMFYTIQIAPSSLAAGKAAFDTSRYYYGSVSFWTGGIFNGLSGFILTWTLFYGLVQA
ncbi:DUF786 family protein [Cordyceps militaris CM01]|uniref:ER membrane protein complex subunit 6 n=2 Tax=Cordyceps militaris TaxID=73501 RepID=G3JN71_CORMM|nr:DUF786 family protein [Cordyceps militaris CM01]ATY63223.1 DUF786 family [Cordyceps militaris]EGX90253.1 DUF786 family protein [Cordyceps militaris CM01]